MSLNKTSTPLGLSCECGTTDRLHKLHASLPLPVSLKKQLQRRSHCGASKWSMHCWNLLLFQREDSKTIFNIFMELSYMVPSLLSHIFASKSTPTCILICSLSANITIALSVSPLFNKQRNNTQVIKKSRSPNAKFCFCTMSATILR